MPSIRSHPIVDVFHISLDEILGYGPTGKGGIALEM